MWRPRSRVGGLFKSMKQAVLLVDAYERANSKKHPWHIVRAIFHSLWQNKTSVPTAGSLCTRLAKKDKTVKCPHAETEDVIEISKIIQEQSSSQKKGLRQIHDRNPKHRSQDRGQQASNQSWWRFHVNRRIH